MFDLTSFRLQHMAACGAALRHIGTGASSIDDAANRITGYLYNHLTTPGDDQPACVLVRLFKTHPYERLSPDLQAVVNTRLGRAPLSPGTKCLTLLGSTGLLPAWNDVTRSSGFRAIPLENEAAVRNLPMFSQLFAQFDIHLPFLLHAPSTLLLNPQETAFNVFYVPDAVGSPYVPAQEAFVRRFGVRSVLGFGGLLPTGELFAIILFTRCLVPRDTAELFQPFAYATRLSLMPFERPELTLPSPHGRLPEHDVSTLEHRVATLESLLAVQEQSVAIQSRRLDATLEDLRAHGRRFESLSAASPVGIFQTDACGSCLYTNAAWQHITGLSSVQALGQGWMAAVAEEDRNAVRGAWFETTAAALETLVLRVVRPDGTLRWVEGRIRAVADETGQRTGYVGTLEDITDRKLSETEQMKLMAVLEASLHEIYLFRADDWRFTYVNHQARHNLGYTMDLLRGLTPLDVAVEMPEAAFRDLLRPLVAKEQLHVRFETVHRRKDGSEYPVEVHVQLVSHEGAHTFLALMYDMTGRLETERQLHHSQALLHSIVTHLPSMVFVKDAASLRFVEFNHAGEDLTGMTREELLGRSDYDFFPKEEADSFTEADRAVLQSKTLQEIPEERIHTRHKGVRILRTKKIPLLDRDGSPQYLLGISEDITERIAVDEELRAAKVAADAAARSKAEFLATMSHEIRTPMNGIIGMMEMLLGTDLAPDQRDYAESVRSASDGLLRIVNDILDFSKIEAGGVTLEDIAFDLRASVEEVLDVLAEPAHRNAVELCGLVHADVPAELRGDPGRLRQILTNLVGNAIKFTKDGEVLVRVTRAEGPRPAS
ncbi:MAG: PAS domain S-box protein, partial [Nitrospiraceae bacterium]|nr:PAS domain S-box protein [Nitrospiraceae bacterium]